MSVTFWWILRKHDTIRWTFCHDPSKIGESSRWSSRVHQHANNADQDLNNYDIPHKLNSIIVICAARKVNHANKSQYRPNLKVKLIFFIEITLKFMKDMAERLCWDHMEKTNKTFVMFKFCTWLVRDLFVSAKIQINMCGLSANENTKT